MASPQLENGHLKIANEVWEHLIQSGMSASEFPIVMAVIRQTWGWKRKQAEISLSNFQSLTKQPPRTIAYSLKSLLTRNILNHIVGGGRGIPSKWSFNKDWESWKTVQPIAENVNCAIQNTVFHCSQTVQPIAEIPATHCTVSSDKPLEAKEQESPKTIFKESKTNIGVKAPRAKDEAYEIWCSEFLEHRKIPYRSKKADWVQLAGLRKQLGLLNGKSTPDGWSTAIHNYLLSPLASYSLAGMCSRFDVFLSSALDRFNKPVTAKPTGAGHLYDGMKFGDED